LVSQTEKVEEPHSSNEESAERAFDSEHAREKKNRFWPASSVDRPFCARSLAPTSLKRGQPQFP